ncbi:GlsB/YeaQ/YmgE family stress response membrane protein [Bryobacter aggregatus]|uniref:GlsB/YeaQ/YmgE family stress response membrane protein n=1 Tax=Bryobacter aggregatus TaxID=360054 RepID=UPI0004E0C0B0|nr:GlsB/YeaQ/YmgE family stress response membrane protein [Bryobacter aggregatus]
MIGTIVFGLIIGAVAKFLMPGKDPGGFILTCLLGIAGSLVGGYIGRALHLYAEGEAAGWLMSLLGAVLLLAVYRMITVRAK